MDGKILVHSADSHVREPTDLFTANLPPRLAERAPRRLDQGDGSTTTIVEDYVVLRSKMNFSEANRPTGSRGDALDVPARLQDLDDQGIHRELTFPTHMLFLPVAKDTELVRRCCELFNDWAHDAIMKETDRLLVPATISMIDTDDAVRELERAADLGFQSVFLATTPPEEREFNKVELWEPIWSAAEEADLTICFHVGSGTNPQITRGLGGAVINYVETFFPAQRSIAHLVACGSLDRHPKLRVLMAEAGATWVPCLADRMDEAYRQHAIAVRPKLRQLPSEIIYSQVFASFQHDRTAIAAVTAMGYGNVCWGSDYPHLEGTWPNTQKVLHELFDDVDPDVTRRITSENFERLFPSVAASGSGRR